MMLSHNNFLPSPQNTLFFVLYFIDRKCEHDFYVISVFTFILKGGISQSGQSNNFDDTKPHNHEEPSNIDYEY